MPLPGRDVCVMHAPDMAEKVAAARMRGGTAAAKVRMLQGKRLRLDTAGALVRFTSGLVQDVLAGTVDPDTAKVCLYGVSIQRQLIEVAELERQVAQLEAQHAGRRV
jgi:hypothetical protein